jgi:hypothetical protein
LDCIETKDIYIGMVLKQSSHKMTMIRATGSIDPENPKISQ